MSEFVTPNTPNLPDFLTFLATSVQIPAAALPSGSAWPEYALSQALALAVPPSGMTPGVMYSLAVYNGATHTLFVITPDQPGQSYFANARAGGAGGYGLNTPSTGLVVEAHDESTGNSLAQPEWAADLTIDQLDYYKTPWGRTFMAWNQKYGPTIWGLT